MSPDERSMSREPMETRGYPDNYEFRLSSDGRQFAIWEPGNEPWFVPLPSMQGRFVSPADMNSMGWTRYLPAADPKRVEELMALLADFGDPDDCWFDHHGYCQTHGWTATDPQCPHARAKELLRQATTSNEH